MANLADSYDAVPSEVYISSPALQESTIDITTLAQAWVNGMEPNYGLMLIGSQEGAVADYASRNWAFDFNRPYMEVIYKEPILADPSTEPPAPDAGSPDAGTPDAGTPDAGTPDAGAGESGSDEASNNGEDAQEDTQAVETNGTPTTVKFDVTQDIMVFSLSPEANYADEFIILTNKTDLYEKRSMLQFDLSTIPTDAEVISATFALSPVGIPSTDVNIHRVTAFWEENEATWQNLANEYIESPVATLSGNIDGVTADLTSLVQKWVEGSAPNFGFTLINEGPEHFAAHSREWQYGPQRPYLEVTYQMPAEPEPSPITDSAPSADPSPEAELTLSSFLNGQAADASTQIPINLNDVSQLSWAHTVHNTGQAEITGISLTDGTESTITCPKDWLASGEQMSCQAHSPAKLGVQMNFASACGYHGDSPICGVALTIYVGSE